jgi:hypothetical protein
VWVPTGDGPAAHGGPHWDVQTPGGGYVNVYPGGREAALVKNIQVVDGADNCTYSIFSLEQDEFEEIFVGDHDIEFADEVVERLGEARARAILDGLWKRPVDKKSVSGIHGTLFYELERKKRFYPARREDQMDPPASYSIAQRGQARRV